MTLTKRDTNTRSERLAKRSKLDTTSKKQVPNQAVTPVKNIEFEPTTPVQALREAKLRFRRCMTPKKLIGRDNERSIIQSFIETNVIGQQGNSLYISGCPGTGKTALVTEILNDLNLKDGQVCVVNCMNFNEPKKLYQHLVSEWNLKLDQKIEPREVLRNYLQSTKSSR